MLNDAGVRREEAEQALLADGFNQVLYNYFNSRQEKFRKIILKLF